MSSSVIFIDCSDFGNNNYVFSFNDNFFIAISYRLYSVHIHLNVSSFIEIRQLQVLYGFYLLHFRAWFQLFCLCSLYSATGATVEHHLTVIRVVMGRFPNYYDFFPGSIGALSLALTLHRTFTVSFQAQKSHFPQIFSTQPPGLRTFRFGGKLFDSIHADESIFRFDSIQQFETDACALTVKHRLIITYDYFLMHNWFFCVWSFNSLLTHSFQLRLTVTAVKLFSVCVNYLVQVQCTWTLDTLWIRWIYGPWTGVDTCSMFINVISFH